MDPVTVFGLLAAAVSLIKAGRTICVAIHDSINGPEFVRQLKSKLSVFTILLESLERSLRHEAIGATLPLAHIKVITDEAQRTLTELNHIVEEILKGENDEFRRLKWIQNERKSRSLKKRLASHQDSLQTILSAAQSEHILRHGDSVRLLTQYFHTMVHRQDPQLLQFSTETLEATMGDTELVVSKTTLPLSAHSNITMPVAEKATSQSLTSVPDVSERPKHPTLFANDSQASPHILGHNHDDEHPSSENPCRCSCHSSPLMALPEAIHPKRDRGTAKLSLKFLQCCSLPSCKATRTNSLRKVIVSSQILKQAIGIGLISRRFNKQFHLKTYRIVEETSDSVECAVTGNLEGLKKLIESGQATVNDIADDNWTLLHNAAYYGHVKVVKYLLKKRADPNIGEISTRTAADLAVIRALDSNSTDIQREIVDAFPTSDDFQDSFGFTPVHIATLNIYDKEDSERPNLDAVLAFIEDTNNAPASTNWKQRKRKLQSENRSPLFTEILATYSSSASPSSTSLSTTHQDKKHRFSYPKPSLPQKQIHHFIDQRDTKQGWTPFHWAVQTGRISEMRKLISEGANPFLLTPRGRNALHQAAESNRSEMINAILQIPRIRRGSEKDTDTWFNINLPDHWSETPLHVASYQSSPCVAALLSAGADRSIATLKEAQVPLHYAHRISGSEERFLTVQLLTQTNQGNHINARNNKGRTPIFYFLDSVKCVRMLVEQGAEVGVIDSEGRSLLHFACMEAQPSTLAYLLEILLSQPHPRNELQSLCLPSNDDHLTPLDHAFISRSVPCLTLLLQLPYRITPFSASGYNSEGFTPAHQAARLGDTEVLELTFGLGDGDGGLDDHGKEDETESGWVKGTRTRGGESVADIAFRAEVYKKVKDVILKWEGWGGEIGGLKKEVVERKGKGVLSEDG